MSVKIIKNTQEELIFVTEINESLANAIRRSTLEIPILAIDEMEFYKNDSVLYDEVLALRFGLLPLEQEKLKLREECDCKGNGCNKCSIQLKLKASGPGMVYAKELKGGVKPVYPEMPIVYLAESQELELIAFAKLGKGIEHTKYSPGLVYYRHVPEIVGNKKDPEVIKRYPTGILKFENGEVTFVNKYMCDYYDSDNNQDFKIVPGKELVFCIESWKQITPKEILLKSIKSLRNNLDEFEKSLK